MIKPMYNLKSKFSTFYEEEVRLSDKEIESLREKKRKNVERLKDGLEEYNEENSTSYKVVEVIEQGSVAMRTVVQYDKKEYDIDVAVVFEADSIPEGTTKVKKIVEDALKRKCSQFKASPIAKTNSVRVDYASGYHIDFAVYRKKVHPITEEVYYEHCGSEWRERDPRAIKAWFTHENNESDNHIRKVVRLLKMFCKSNDGWLMPGGLIQSVLVAEKIEVKDRLDETFYETIKLIRDRLEYNKEVYNPTLLGLHSLLYKTKDHQKVKNLYTRLDNALTKLDVLFEETCTEEQALNAWNTFFNHPYWGEDIAKSAAVQYAVSQERQQLLNLKAVVVLYEQSRIPLEEFVGKIPKGCHIEFSVDPLVKYTKIEWIVHNYGDEAKGNEWNKEYGTSVKRDTKYRGQHTMTCKLYEGARVIAQDTVYVNIK
ncbi:nucleotidyltransferase [Alkalihalophilus pseudofirmus]|uniref:Cyclic GMP-AMP synthase n=1 Tax=Alkalihalophilus pseudofirmus TaxID=79885 RepID=A0AAJ2L123_ALKPS|nr:nucleotidyltransferase [Alkalihalophilus pseudofirmus]MDV2884804.1 nucleotidyltransferase [Alkalihalophilus pseudofirmus]